VVSAIHETHVSDLTLYLIAFGPLVYCMVAFWAMAEAWRRERWGWVAAIFVLGPIGLIAWFGKGRREAGPSR
jgi:hypothetical protein